MTTHAVPLESTAAYPIRVHVTPSFRHRARLTTAFRPLLALPHLLLVGGPLTAVLTWAWGGSGERSLGAGGALGAVAGVCALIAWFAIVFTARSPQGLADLARFYLRWRVRATSYVALLRDEYPPFGEGAYPAMVDIPAVAEPRDRLSVAFRPILVIPHLLAIWVLGFAWAITTIIAWFAILFTERYPRALYEFSVGVFRWTTRVEAYLLLLVDDYPPFTLA